ncbi:MAG: HNH endonuclease signature motif containing protein [Patescibacteria group bacterium]
MEKFYNDRDYVQKQSLLTKLSWQKGERDHLRKREVRTCIRPGCKNNFTTIHWNPKKYCGRSCAAKVNNIGRIMSLETRTKIAGGKLREKKFCMRCNITLGRQNKYCSPKCHSDYNYYHFIELWKKGEKDGGIGINVRSISGYLRRYLLEKYNNRCGECGWNKKHLITGTVPLEIDHIDGNSENNVETNLKLLCPNCHALTPFFKNLNRGKGREWRMKKYTKN